ncbi:MAG: glycoside hydrolase family 43 protein, partial [Xanthomonadales bacterium]|nr:glycoside hydrolase family 43 protein [Xanthomonadales bacterium]
RDLENWTLAARPLNRPDLLDLSGVPDSCGVWAPCLSWHDGLFHLCYTVVRRFDGNFKDTHNYLTTCATIDGDWSKPVYLDSSGFDPSMHHAEDGRKWYLSMVWDHRPDRTFFRGIALREYCPSRRQLVGERKFIFDGTAFDCTEGPHLYRYGDFYYLLAAEGGTGYEHVVTVARSRDLEGPYEVDPAGPLVTARYSPVHPLQRTGHGDIVRTPGGRLFIVFLCSRPLPGTRRSPLGRESAIQELVETDDGWFRLKSGSSLPLPELEIDLDGTGSAKRASATAEEVIRYGFDSDDLPDDFQWLRSPRPERLFSLRERPGNLRLHGRESIGSFYEQALVARRQTHFRFRAETALEFEPAHFQQMAGLVCYYNASKFHYLYVSRDEEVGKHLAVMSCEGEILLDAVFPEYGNRVAVPEGQKLHLRVDVDGARLVFSWSADGDAWNEFPVSLDASLLSDEAGKGEGAQFTGAFVGICCQDMAGTGRPADFRYFCYEGR